MNNLQEMSDLQSFAQATKNFAEAKVRSFPEKVVYHNIEFVQRIIKNIEEIGSSENLSARDLNMAKSVALFFSCGFDQIKVKIEDGNIFDNIDKLSLKCVDSFLEKHPEFTHLEAELKDHLSKINFFHNSELPIQQVVSDSITADLVDTNDNTHLKAMYQEILLNNMAISKLNWYEAILQMAHGLVFYTDYGKNKLAPQVKTQIENLEKERGKIAKQADKALKKELDISDKELKKLKKNLKNLSGRDERAIQTLFRTTSKNHYTLNEMVDRKASIMITVNSIILSVVLSGIIERQGFEHRMFYIPIVVLAVASLISIIFAVLSTRPVTTHGKFTEEEVRGKQGNLLFYGNFHGMAQRDFEWGMLQMLNDADYLYGSMIRDLYFLGQTLSRKYKFVRISLNAFLIGFVISLLLFLILRCFVHVPH